MKIVALETVVIWTVRERQLTQLSTEEAHSVVAAQSLSLVLIEADKTIVLVVLINDVSSLAGWDAIVGFSLNKRNMTESMSFYLADFQKTAFRYMLVFLFCIYCFSFILPQVKWVAIQLQVLAAGLCNSVTAVCLVRR